MVLAATLVSAGQICLCDDDAPRPYDIVATSPDAGVIEAIPDTVSLDALKKVGVAFGWRFARGWVGGGGIWWR